jgi:hypothetical protein
VEGVPLQVLEAAIPRLAAIAADHPTVAPRMAADHRMEDHLTAVGHLTVAAADMGGNLTLDFFPA